MKGELASGWEKRIPSKADLPQEPTATRKASGILVNAFLPDDESFISGSADIMESTFINFKGSKEFQKPDGGLGDYKGRLFRFGIREHAMVGLGNGLAAYQKGMFIP